MDILTGRSRYFADAQYAPLRLAMCSPASGLARIRQATFKKCGVLKIAAKKGRMTRSGIGRKKRPYDAKRHRPKKRPYDAKRHRPKNILKFYRMREYRIILRNYRHSIPNAPSHHT